MNQAIAAITAGRDVRASLSELRRQLKEEGEALREEINAEWDQNPSVFTGLFQSEDAKTRKNIALLTGDLGRAGLAGLLFETYLGEKTRFVRAAYLEALLALYKENKGGDPFTDILDRLGIQLEELEKTELTEENRKHLTEEKRLIRKLLIADRGIRRHTFIVPDPLPELLLVTNRNLREQIRRSIKTGQTRVHPLGILIKNGSLKELNSIRTWREMLFPVNGGKCLSADPKKAAAELAESDLLSLLSLLHREEAPFYYRIELKCSLDLKTKADFATRLSDSLDLLAAGKLINSPSDYEVELRLMATREGSWFAAVRPTGFRDMRFEYRKNAIASSINPSQAALIAELARPWLKEKAQVMDPFCGVATMLVERNAAVAAGDMYGTDTFGRAIDLGRENTDLAGLTVNLIHRDFFDFTHTYPFDEIITDMPVRGKRTREEMDDFYSRFFRKMPEILAEEAVVILYSGEGGFVKKQLRLHREFSLLQETSMVTGTKTRPGFDLFILRYRREQ